MPPSASRCDAGTDLHLPGFINAEGELEKKGGIEQVALLTTNDVFVNRAWLKAVEGCVGKESKIVLISDGDGDAVRAMGLMGDMGFGLGARAKRFALVLDGGVVKHVAVDEGMEKMEATSAEAVISVLPDVFPKPKPGEPSSKSQSESAGAAAFALLALAALGYFYQHPIANDNQQFIDTDK